MVVCFANSFRRGKEIILVEDEIRFLFDFPLTEKKNKKNLKLVENYSFSCFFEKYFSLFLGSVNVQFSESIVYIEKLFKRKDGNFIWYVFIVF